MLDPSIVLDSLIADVDLLRELELEKLDLSALLTGVNLRFVLKLGLGDVDGDLKLEGLDTRWYLPLLYRYQLLPEL